jgi:hypothetical protein
VSKSCARTATQLLKLKPNKTTVIHARLVIQLAVFIFAVGFYSLIEGEIYQQLTFFSAEAWFHLQGYI